MTSFSVQTPDRDLVIAYRNGDNAAITLLLERYSSKIRNYIMMLVKDDAAADDIFQEVFLKISASILKSKYSDEGKFINWALRIAHNKAIDHFRQRKPFTSLSADGNGTLSIEEQLSTGESIENDIVKGEAEVEIRELIDKLPIEQREVVILRHYLDMSFKEISEQTGVSINTSLGRMRYALINLRKMMNS